MADQEENNNDTDFFTRLENRITKINSLLCVGLDPHIKELKISSDDDDDSNTEENKKCNAAYTFCKTIIDSTVDYACCYKPNIAFFEALAPTSGDGIKVLNRLIMNDIPTDIPIILDIKRGDIGSTAAAYASAAYEILSNKNHQRHAISVTLSPLMGYDSIKPFITKPYSNNGVFILCKTSNPSSNEILTLQTKSSTSDEDDSMLLYERLANFATTWSKQAMADDNHDNDKNDNRIGLVVGATDPVALCNVRQTLSSGKDSDCDDKIWILAPGIGAQGGSLKEAAMAGLNSKGTGMIFPMSRGLSQASNIEETAKDVVEQINAVRQEKIQQSSLQQEQSNDNSSSVTSQLQQYQKDFITFSLKEGVLKFGSFTLKSGRVSPYFFNAGLFSSGEALYKLAKSYAATIMKSCMGNENGGVNFDVIFGPAYKGISLGAVVCSELYRGYGVNVGFAYNRKEAKDHGEGGTLVGCSMENKKVLIIDDVITAGTAIRESHDMLQKISGTNVVGVVIALDRAEKRSLDDPISAVQAVERDLSIPVISIVSLPQLQIFLEKSVNSNDDTAYDSSVLSSVTSYREQYGV